MAKFQEQVNDYGKRGHAELVPIENMSKPNSEVAYLPLHGVEKSTSSTTKLRVVSDASAKSSTGVSLNDTLLPGPSLYPPLTTLLLKFRTYNIAVSADIAKMFWEISVHPEDRDFLRFLVRNDKGQVEDWRMTRVTFGVTSSPFLATASLRQAGLDHADEHFTAKLIPDTFYVDDFIYRADTKETAFAIFSDLSELLSKRCFNLRKWRSNDKKLLCQIPEELREAEPLHLEPAPQGCPKTLGLHWDTHTDNLHVSTPAPVDQPLTKRFIASQTAKVYDVLGWFAPTVLKAKHLMQLLWKTNISWDEPIPTEYMGVWNRWSNELKAISTFAIPRKIVQDTRTVQQVQLHGFSDASQLAFGAVVYARHLHSDSSVTVALLMAKTRVAPTKSVSIPRLELCGATLLAQLVTYVAESLNIPKERIYCWCDSTAVLGWLRASPEKHSIYVKNHVIKVTDCVPSSQWRYVATDVNPADAASRGAFPEELVSKKLWWEGPQWLTSPPAEWPVRLDIGDPPVEEQANFPVPVLHVQRIDEPPELLMFSSLYKLIRFWAYARRWILAVRAKHSPNSFLTNKELQAAEQSLIIASQRKFYPQ